VLVVNETKGSLARRAREIQLGDRMRHYSLEQWVDFARNVIREDEKTKMESHLHGGCARCSKELGIWQRLQQVAKRESNYAPAKGAVGTVNVSFVSRQQRPRGETSSQAVSLLFDSLRSPLLAGVRSAGIASRQVLYGAGTYRIDVRIEPQMDSEKVVLIGQVLNSADPEERLPELPVTLLKGRKVLAESKTRPSGEFQIECELDGGFQLMVVLPGETEVKLPLIDPAFHIEDSSSQDDDYKPVTGQAGTGKKGTRTNG
jgi:hypothetical protein